VTNDAVDFVSADRAHERRETGSSNPAPSSGESGEISGAVGRHVGVGSDWRAGRNAVYKLAALTIGARLKIAVREAVIGLQDEGALEQ
jgi:hypothetical protein